MPWRGVATDALHPMRATRRGEACLAPGADYRIPHDLKEDYWLYERFVSQAAEDHGVTEP